MLRGDDQGHVAVAVAVHVHVNNDDHVNVNVNIVVNPLFAIAPGGQQ